MAERLPLLSSVMQAVAQLQLPGVAGGAQAGLGKAQAHHQVVGTENAGGQPQADVVARAVDAVVGQGQARKGPQRARILLFIAYVGQHLQARVAEAARQQIVDAGRLAQGQVAEDGRVGAAQLGRIAAAVSMPGSEGAELQHRRLAAVGVQVLQHGVLARAHACAGLHAPVDGAEGHPVLHAAHAHGQRLLRHQVAAQRGLQAQPAVQCKGMGELHGGVAVQAVAPAQQEFADRALGPACQAQAQGTLRGRRAHEGSLVDRAVERLCAQVQRPARVQGHVPVQALLALADGIQVQAAQLQSTEVAEGQQLLGQRQMQGVVVGLVALRLEGCRLRQPHVAGQRRCIDAVIAGQGLPTADGCRACCARARTAATDSRALPSTRRAPAARQWPVRPQPPNTRDGPRWRTHPRADQGAAVRAARLVPRRPGSGTASGGCGPDFGPRADLPASASDVQPARLPFARRRPSLPHVPTAAGAGSRPGHHPGFAPAHRYTASATKNRRHARPYALGNAAKATADADSATFLTGICYATFGRERRNRKHGPAGLSRLPASRCCRVWKILGVTAGVIPGLPFAKRNGPSGFFFAMTGAIFFQLAMGDAGKDFSGRFFCCCLRPYLGIFAGGT
ncbi:hypothetical protein FQR65_LT20514 [Abscondita terminalis]|nr:hypothetical protein FQR65_LT20514 [Abscondita terminalis]